MKKSTEFLLVGLYGRTHLTFSEVCDQIGIAVQTGYNKRSKGAFPIKMHGNPLRASAAEVAQYLDNLGKEKT